MSTTQINNNIVDLSTLPQTTPSMCIPRVFSNITKERILGIFNDLNIGSIERIDQVFRTNDDGAHFQRVFVHIRWNDDEISNKARTRLLQGKDIKIIYNDPWFWKVSANRSVARDTRQKEGGRSRDAHFIKPTLHVSSDEERDETNMQRIKHQKQQRGRGGRGAGGRGGGRGAAAAAGGGGGAAVNFAKDATIATHDLSMDLGISPPTLTRTMTKVDATIDDDLEEGEVPDEILQICPPTLTRTMTTSVDVTIDDLEEGEI